MKQIYDGHFEQMRGEAIEGAREKLGQSRPRVGARGGPGRGIAPGEGDLYGYTRDAQSEIEALFPRLPNPTLVLYVFPHLTGAEGAPVPGYATSFPLYPGVEYALPGEADLQ
jgi:conjugative transfer region lipoprotein (TIGR03751 family)